MSKLIDASTNKNGMFRYLIQILGVKALLNRIGEKIVSFLSLSSEENDIHDPVFPQTENSLINAYESPALTHKFDMISTSQKLNIHSNNIPIDNSQEKKPSEIRRPSFESSQTFATKSGKRKVNPVIKISTYIINSKFNQETNKSKKCGSAFSAISDAYPGINHDFKNIINFNDFHQIASSSIHRPAPVKPHKQINDDKAFINSKRSRDNSYQISLLSKMRKIENADSESQKLVTTSNHIERDDVSMKSYHTNNFKGFPNRMDITSEKDNYDTLANPKLLSDKTLSELRKEIDEKRRKNQEYFDLLSQKESITNMTNKEKEKALYEEKRKIIDKYYREKAKNRKELEILPLNDKSSENDKERSHLYPESTWNEINFSKTHPTNINIISLATKNIHKPLLLVNQESFFLQKEIKEPDKKSERISQSIMNTTITNFSNEQNVSIEKKYNSTNEDKEKNNKTNEKVALNLFNSNIRDEKKMGNLFINLTTPSADAMPLFSNGGKILNTIEEKSIKQIEVKNGNNNTPLFQVPVVNEKPQEGTLFKAEAKGTMNLFYNSAQETKIEQVLSRTNEKQPNQTTKSTSLETVQKEQSEVKIELSSQEQCTSFLSFTNTKNLFSKESSMVCQQSSQKEQSQNDSGNQKATTQSNALPSAESTNSLLNNKNPFISVSKTANSSQLLTSPTRQKENDYNPVSMTSEHLMKNNNQLITIITASQDIHSKPTQNESDMSICTPITSPKIPMKADDPPEEKICLTSTAHNSLFTQFPQPTSVGQTLPTNKLFGNISTSALGHFGLSAGTTTSSIPSNNAPIPTSTSASLFSNFNSTQNTGHSLFSLGTLNANSFNNGKSK